MSKTFIVLILLVLFSLLTSCHKSSGAICNDGSRSYSTGRGTCSWHRGVNHYIDTNEFNVTKSAGLIFVIVIGGLIIGSKRIDS